MAERGAFGHHGVPRRSEGFLKRAPTAAVMATRVAFLGLGGMGSRMARRAIEAGFDVVVWNRTAERCEPLVSAGAEAAATPMEAAMGAQVVVSMVADDDASGEVWSGDGGALGGIEMDAVAVECSTLTPLWLESLAGALEAVGVPLVDAPVVGSLPQAAAGELWSLVGGPKDAVAQARPVIEAWSSRIEHFGGVTRGAAAKLIVNSVLGTTVALWSELRALGADSGLDPDHLNEFIGDFATQKPLLASVSDRMHSKDPNVYFPLRLLEKDLRYTLNHATGLDRSMPLVEAVRDLLDEAVEAGHGDEDMTAVRHLYE